MAIAACAAVCVCVNTARAQERGEEPIAPKIEAFEPDSFFARRQVLRHDVLMFSGMLLQNVGQDVQDSTRALYIGMRFMENGLRPLRADYADAGPGRDQVSYWQAYTKKARKGKARTHFNVAGVVCGMDPDIARRLVVVGVRTDNMGSMAVMLELLRYYSQFPMEKSLVFVALGREERENDAWQAFWNAFPLDKSCVDAVVLCPPVEPEPDWMMRSAARLGEALRLLLNR
ncbi:MAG: hypothetical protein NC396_06000 [Bacteroides sp.]|nr:hypothetical protein [Bacteroides sp.]MCM1085907.1 hypothetical protein [Bacteroides sp.]